MPRRRFCCVHALCRVCCRAVWHALMCLGSKGLTCAVGMRPNPRRFVAVPGPLTCEGSSRVEDNCRACVLSFWDINRNRAPYRTHAFGNQRRYALAKSRWLRLGVHDCAARVWSDTRVVRYVCLACARFHEPLCDRTCTCTCARCHVPLCDRTCTCTCTTYM